jgi:phospholipid/cholesterol/gamma-HCH transport system ATP-binding protein
VKQALDAALGSDGATRLRSARTSVAFSTADGQRVTLLLDGAEPRIGAPGDPTEVELELSAAQAERFVCGALHLPTELARGTVVARGPLRKYLRVDPILRGLLRSVDAPPEARGTADRAVATGPLAPDLLAIETRDLHKRFGATQVLRGANLAVPEGVIAVVVGPSGTGKSVLLRHTIGLLRPDAGEVLVRGRSLSTMSRSEILALRLEVGVMFQDGALFSSMDVYDNVAFPLRQHTDMTDDEIREAVMRRLESVGLADAARRRPAQLSGGMRKRAGLARALVLEPGIVLCDEPDSGLDPVRTALLGELLVDQHDQIGGTMLVITHNIALAQRIAEHVSVLWQGQVVAGGPAEDVFASDDAFIRQFLAAATEGPLSMDAA